MRAQLSSVVVLSAGVLAAAMPWETTSPATSTTTVTVTAPASTSTEPASSCDTGSLQCCDTVTSAKSESASAILGLLGVVLSNLDVLVGLTCSPISVLSSGSSGCTADPVCCENNNFSGLISLGCVPVNLSLK
ncbi:fungal hydrophobin [Coniophora puteana RWD-64-598 SS2]|uniref:Hydrophobin n=1 Tax=Coniophora puteana (strain RWD-64-598) TaxID=741705 RepID=A0A5M3N3B3_CONPW|nr:fungal hydrophobin [Coniophora puteana RWD-64-598 SS2]EIW85899.1 fungal hydrophobin [Coniophora puteana RWD-64-598 SS2]